jgi:hypothetical protein
MSEEWVSKKKSVKKARHERPKFTYLRGSKPFLSMQISITRLLFLLIFCGCYSFGLSAQVTVTGTVLDQRTNKPLPGATIQIGTDQTLTDPKGKFSFVVNLEEGTVVSVAINEEDHRELNQVITIGSKGAQPLGTLYLTPGDDLTNDLTQELLPTISVTDLGDDGGSGSQTVSSLLGANRDPFVSAAAFNWGVARFRIRGYDSEYTDFFLNGLPFNDLETGRVFFAQWGGLNRVTSNRTANVGLDGVDYGFNGIGGGSTLDLRARNQRKQTRMGYAISNRTYRNRLMGSHVSKTSEKGWTYAVAGSYRWADEGFVEGTPYEAFSYFLSVDKDMGKGHFLSFSGFGAPGKRGGGFPAIQESNELAGTNYYNPNWGLQNGEKRNARISNFHQPILMLRHDYEPNSNFSLNTSMAYQFGRGGRTSLDWFDAPDPRPDYYRRLPSFQQDSETAAAVDEAFRNDINVRQINWDNLYAVNRNSLRTIQDVDGIEGNDVTGLRAKYIVEDRRNDVQRRIFASNFRYNPSDNITLSGGFIYSSQTTENFKVVDDLLGADFYVDIDRFATFDSIATSDFAQNDLDNPNRLLREGDRFGYDYETHTRDAKVWLQNLWQTNKFDYFIGGQLGVRKLWRDGQTRNGRFPQNSFGRSAREYFAPFALKGGLTYKLNGRNYFLLNATVQEIAPNTRDAFISPRSRNTVVEDLVTQKIKSIEGGYQFRSPNLSMRFLAYFTEFKDQTSVRTFFLDNAIRDIDGTTSGGFVNYIITGQESVSKGIEASIEYKLTPELEIQAVAAIGSHRFANRPVGQAVLDNFDEISASRRLYIKNYVVPGSPQTAGTLGLRYQPKGFWFVNVNANFFDNIYLDFFPQRRTIDAVSTVQEPTFGQQIVNDELFDQIIKQEKAPSAFTLDVFGGKSFKFGSRFVYINLGINNILDKRDFVTGGFEQSRFDFEGRDVDRFPARQFYAFGRNYFVSVDFSL